MGMTSSTRVWIVTGALLALAGGRAQAQPLPERLLRLQAAAGPAGEEEAVRAEIRAQLPPWASPKVDGIGNLVVTLGSGAPHVALVASLDERTWVVSRITDDGYLRLHRPSPPTSHPLGDQFLVGNPVLVHASVGRSVQGVVATPSTHLGRLELPESVGRIKEVRDLWVDVGAANPREVAQLGIRMLDPVSLRERAQPLAEGKVAGVDAQLRAGAQSLVELLRGYSAPPAVKGTVTVAWVAQSQFGRRGLARLASTIRPDRVYLLGRGGSGPAPPPPPGWESVAIDLRSVPVRYPESPVEVVDARDVAALAAELAEAAGLPKGELGSGSTARLTAPPPSSPVKGAPPAPASARQTLTALLESYGVSGHEGPVREEVLRRLPAWAKPEVDDKGNVTVRFGSGGKELVFVAHLDEVGFEVLAIRPDGSATLRARGGMYLSLYEAHPVLVHAAKGTVPAVLAPREKYLEAKTGQPELAALALDFGTTSEAATRALGIVEGQSVTVRKELAPLFGTRTAGRSMDDRVGSTALLLALRRLDPAQVKNRVTFAWAVEEEVGLHGARALAARLHPDAAFAVDTFVSTDAPLDVQYLANAKLGGGAVLRGLDNATLVPAQVRNRILKLSREAGIPIQVGVTQGGTDASVFSAGGATDIGLSWPGRYSHSPIEVMDLRDLESLVRLIAVLARRY